MKRIFFLALVVFYYCPLHSQLILDNPSDTGQNWNDLIPELKCYILKNYVKSFIINGIHYPALKKNIVILTNVSKDMTNCVEVVLQSNFSFDEILELAAEQLNIISKFALARLLLNKDQYQKFLEQYVTDNPKALAMVLGRSIFDSPDPAPVRDIIKNGAYIDHVIRVTRGEHKGLVGTPLMLAIANKRINIVSFLIASGSNLDFANTNGQTPLTLAKKISDSNIVAQLISAGAQPRDVIAILHVYRNTYCNLL